MPNRCGEGWKVGRWEVELLAGRDLGSIGGRRVDLEATAGETPARLVARRICRKGGTTMGAMNGGMDVGRKLEAGREGEKGRYDRGSN